MTVGIKNFPNCGFGNRIIYYFNLRQEAYKKNDNFFCIPWDGYQHFEGNLLGSLTTQNIENFDFCLGDRFFGYSELSTRDIFKLKNKSFVGDDRCAIHFRGTDFHKWNPESILDSEYYINSIKEIEKDVENFYIFTDDQNLKSFQNAIKYLQNKKVNHIFGENTSDRNKYIQDFAIMSECDYIISSPSTFCISAGFIGKNKKIIHSKKWIDSRINKEDKFWVDLNNGGNFNYSLWKKI